MNKLPCSEFSHFLELDIRPSLTEMMRKIATIIFGIHESIVSVIISSDFRLTKDEAPNYICVQCEQRSSKRCDRLSP